MKNNMKPLFTFSVCVELMSFMYTWMKKVSSAVNLNLYRQEERCQSKLNVILWDREALIPWHTHNHTQLEFPRQILQIWQ